MSSTPQDLCVLFGDVSGSTRLYEKLGDTKAMHAVERCLNHMGSACVANGGRIVKTIGDEIMAVFDSAAAGLMAACDMQQRIDGLPSVSGAKIAIRVGFQFGPTLVENKDVFGDTVNMAARLVGLAKAGQIVTTADTVQRLPPDLRSRTREIDALNVKGKSGQVRLFDVVSRDNAELTMIAGSTTATASRQALATLRHGDTEVVLSPARAAASLGRDVVCDIVIHDPCASRSHGRIELRRDKVVLTDQSTNGTYVTFEGESEFVLKREEAILRGRGRIVFGHAFNAGTTETLEFVVED
jgi:class 3 adenylate cyclase